ncbi:MAG: hypothetical protein ACK2U3_11865 [Anaerolineales bacterium]|jgi:threonine dehydrogenase-like Zn-dependent dehydrogenase
MVRGYYPFTGILGHEFVGEIVVDEITLVGLRCGPFEPALRLMEKRLINPELLIADRFPPY